MHICAFLTVQLQVSYVFVRSLQFNCKQLAEISNVCGSTANDVQWSENVFLHDNKTARNGFIACRLVADLPERVGECAALRFLFVAFGMGSKAIRFVPLLSGLSHASHSVANKP